MNNITTACGLNLTPDKLEDHRYAYCLPCAAADKASAVRQAAIQVQRVAGRQS